MKYPTSYEETFIRFFQKRKDAKEIADLHKVPIEKTAKGYRVAYKGNISNCCKTGRPFYVIDNSGVLHHEIITIVKSMPYDGTSQIVGYDGIFVNRSSINTCLDIFVSTIWDNHPDTKEVIKNLANKEYAKYLHHMNECKPSVQVIKQLTQTDWDKAREANVI